MATRRVTLRVVFSDGKPVPGATVTAYNATAWVGSIKNWSNTTDLDGKCEFENLDTGYGDKYDFSVQYIDREGVVYVGELSDKILFDTERQITLKVAYPEDIESFNIPFDSLNELINDTDGALVVEGFRELGAALKYHMIHASLVLSTYVMEGMIRIRSKRANVWKDEFEALTYGQLIDREEIKTLFSDGELDGAKLLNKHRLFGAHFKGANSILAEAQVCFKIVTDTLSKWFSVLAPTKNTKSNDEKTIDANEN